MNPGPGKHDRERALSDAELELFIDAALTPQDASRVEHALAGSTPDAARLVELREADQLVRAALLAPPAGAMGSAGVAAHPRLGWSLAAAAVLLVAGVTAALMLGEPDAGSASETSAVSPASSLAQSVSPAPYEAVRVVFSMPVAPGARDAKKDEAPGADPKPGGKAGEPTPAAAQLASALGDASDAGIRRTVDAIRRATPEERAAALASLGQTLRSGSIAVRVLDRLEPSDQVAVCGELALDAGLRAVALQRLRDLRDDPIAGPEARATARTLAAAPGMKVWLRSYGLLESNLDPRLDPRLDPQRDPARPAAG